MPTEPDRIAQFENSQPGRACNEALLGRVFGVLRDRTLYVYALADRAAAKAWHETQVGFVAWYDDGPALSWCITADDLSTVGSPARSAAYQAKLGSAYIAHHFGLGETDLLDDGANVYQAPTIGPPGDATARARFARISALHGSGRFNNGCITRTHKVAGALGVNFSAVANTSWSIGVWVRVPPSALAIGGTDGNWPLISSDSLPFPGIELYLDPAGHVCFYQTDGTTGPNRVGALVLGPTIRDGSWHHLGLSYDLASGIARFYLGGVLKETYASAGLGFNCGWLTNVNPVLHVLGRNDTQQAITDSSVNDLALWTSLLSDADFAVLAQG